MSNTLICLYFIWLVSNIISLVILVDQEEKRFKDTDDILFIDMFIFILRTILVILLGPVALAILLFGTIGEK